MPSDPDGCTRSAVIARLVRPPSSTHQSALGYQLSFQPAMRPPPVSAYEEAEREGVANEVEVEEVTAFGLLVGFVREHLGEGAVMGWCLESELVVRRDRILVSIRFCDPRPDEADQSGLLANGTQTLKECVLSVCQGLEVNEQGPGRTLGQAGAGPALSGRGLNAPFVSCLFFRQAADRTRGYLLRNRLPSGRRGGSSS